MARLRLPGADSLRRLVHAYDNSHCTMLSNAEGRMPSNRIYVVRCSISCARL
jgi:hypothetical protein